MRSSPASAESCLLPPCPRSGLNATRLWAGTAWHSLLRPAAPDNGSVSEPTRLCAHAEGMARSFPWKWVPANSTGQSANCQAPSGHPSLFSGIGPRMFCTMDRLGARKEAEGRCSQQSWPGPGRLWQESSCTSLAGTGWEICRGLARGPHTHTIGQQEQPQEGYSSTVDSGPGLACRPVMCLGPLAARPRGDPSFRRASIQPASQERSRSGGLC